MKFDKETFIVIAIALAILVGWGIYYPKQQAKQAEYNRQQAMIAKTQAQYAELARKQETENADRKADPLRTVAEKAEPEAVKASPVASTPYTVTSKLAVFANAAKTSPVWFAPTTMIFLFIISSVPHKTQVYASIFIY